MLVEVKALPQVLFLSVYISFCCVVIVVVVVIEGEAEGRKEKRRGRSDLSVILALGKLRRIVMHLKSA